MWIIAANFRRTHSPSRLAWSEVGGHPALNLHSSDKPGELSQWLWVMMTAPQTLSWLLLLFIITYGLFWWQLKEHHLFQEAWTRRPVTSDMRRHRIALTYSLTSCLNHLTYAAKIKKKKQKQLLKQIIGGKTTYFGIRAGEAQKVLSVSFKASRAGRDPKWRPPIGTHNSCRTTVLDLIRTGNK